MLIFAAINLALSCSCRALRARRKSPSTHLTGDCARSFAYALSRLVFSPLCSRGRRRARGALFRSPPSRRVAPCGRANPARRWAHRSVSARNLVLGTPRALRRWGLRFAHILPTGATYALAPTGLRTPCEDMDFIKYNNGLYLLKQKSTLAGVLKSVGHICTYCIVDEPAFVGLLLQPFPVV